MSADKEQMKKRAAYFTFDEHARDEHGMRLYYFAPVDRSPPPYLTQRYVNAIIDIAADGTLAGVELIDNMPDPPAPPQSSDSNAKIIAGPDERRQALANLAKSDADLL